MMVTLTSGSPPSKNQAVTACPASWYETIFLFSGVMRFLFYSPAITLSAACSKSIASTYLLLLLAAKMAASLQRLAMSAPLKPGVNVANLFAYYSMVFVGSNLMGAKCTWKISLLPLRSGNSISMSLSNRPGLIKAESRTSFLLVAAITMTF